MGASISKPPCPPDPLTNDLMLEVYVRLDTRCICRARAVCKRWNGLLNSQRFFDLYAQQEARRWPMFYGLTRMTVNVAGKWLTASPPLPDCVADPITGLRLPWDVFYLLRTQPKVDIVCGEGMTCFCIRSAEDLLLAIVIYNPFEACLQTVKHPGVLGAEPIIRPIAVITNKQERSYKLFFLEFRCLRICVYDSSKADWTRVELLHAGVPGWLHGELVRTKQEIVGAADFTERALCINGVAYCILGDNMLMYIPEKNEISMLKLPDSKSRLKLKKLVQNGSKPMLLLVTLVRLAGKATVKVWELDLEMERKKWSILTAKVMRDSDHLGLIGLLVDDLLVTSTCRDDKASVHAFNLSTRKWKILRGFLHPNHPKLNRCLMFESCLAYKHVMFDSTDGQNRVF